MHIKVVRNYRICQNAHQTVLMSFLHLRNKEFIGFFLLL